MNTESNARGIVPDLMRAAGLRSAEEMHVIPTMNGSVSLYRQIRLS